MSSRPRRRLHGRPWIVSGSAARIRRHQGHARQVSRRSACSAQMQSNQEGSTAVQSDGRSLIVDLIPVAAVPALGIATIMVAFEQSAVLHTILQQGSLLTFVSLAPLFLPVMAAAAAYSASLRLPAKSAERTGWFALGTGFILAFVVPINYSVLQFGILLAIGIRFIVKRRILRTVSGIGIMLAALVATAVLVIEEPDSRTGVHSDWLYQAAIGRILDGLVSINISYNGSERSVHLVGTNGDFATVISTDYPPKIAYLPTKVVADARPCQRRPSHNQRSLFSYAMARLAGKGVAVGVPACNSRTI